MCQNVAPLNLRTALNIRIIHPEHLKHVYKCEIKLNSVNFGSIKYSVCEIIFRPLSILKVMCKEL